MSGFDYSKASGLGTNTIDRGVLGMPFLNIIQKGSPEFDETHTKHRDKKIEGCRPGNILFEPERAILAQPVIVVPLAQDTMYTEWKPNKGGLVGHHSVDIIMSPQYRKGAKGNPQTEFKEYLGQNELVYTTYVALLFKHNDKWKKGMIAFTATQLKYARRWLQTIIQTKLPDLPDNVEPPIFASSYKLSTFADSNAKGGFYSWQIERDRLLSPTEDQVLLENAFGESRRAALMIPSSNGSQPQPQLAAPAGDNGDPY